MEQRKQAGSGGIVEMLIIRIAGLIMAGLGTLCGWFGYVNATTALYSEWRYLWIAISFGLAFYLLRGAYFTVFPERKVEPLRFNTGGR